MISPAAAICDLSNNLLYTSTSSISISSNISILIFATNCGSLIYCIALCWKYISLRAKSATYVLSLGNHTVYFIFLTKFDTAGLFDLSSNFHFSKFSFLSFSCIIIPLNHIISSLSIFFKFQLRFIKLPIFAIGNGLNSLPI